LRLAGVGAKLRARLREATLRLKTRSDKVLSIPLDAGFRDLSNFNHAFRAEFGVSPTRFRSKMSSGVVDPRKWLSLTFDEREAGLP